MIGDLTESCPSTPDSRNGALSLLCSLYDIFDGCFVRSFVVVVVVIAVVVVGIFFLVVVIFSCYCTKYLRKKINCKTFYEISHN